MTLGHALKWSFLSELVSKAVSPLVFVVLARLLTPDDYGVVAAASMVISFSGIFWEAGMGKAIIQYQGERAAAANVAFWINIVMGVVVAGVLVAISSLVAEHIFHDPRVTLVLRVMAAQVFLSASVSVHVALLQKDMQFKHLFWVRLATVAIPGMASISLAWQGMGYWALVAGSVVGQVFQVAILWKTSPWRPRWRFEPAIAKQLGRFGAWVAATGLLAWFYGWVDSLVIVRYLGTYDLGLYRIGTQFDAMIFSLIFSPITSILYPYLSINNTIPKVHIIMRYMNRSAIYLNIILAGYIVINATLVEQFVFNAHWVGINKVIALMAVQNAISYVVCINNEAFRAIDRPNIETSLMAITMPFYLVGYFVSVKYGFVCFLLTRVILTVLGALVHFLVIGRILKISIYFFLKNAVVAFIIVIFGWGLTFHMIEMIAFPSIDPIIQRAVISTGFFIIMLIFLKNNLIYKAGINKEFGRGL
jgi:O-antigen/teichoic acid export membrane protein